MYLMTKTRGLQLFPLQTVLYPYCILPLHIFEPRYRTMIRMCMEHDVPFGVVQVLPGGLNLVGEERIYEVGTMAHITSAVEFADGRMFITAQGERRFRVVESQYDGPCLTARVEPYQDEPVVESKEVQELVEDVRHLFGKYWQLLEIATKRELGKLDLPVEAKVLSWLVPSVLHVQPEIKQGLLQKRKVEERLMWERELLVDEVEKLLEMMRHGRGGAFQ
jgi:Lon protease-like protein